MIQVTILRDGQITNSASFPTEAEALAWLSSHESMKTFGEPAHTVQQQVEISPAVLAEDGSVLQEAVVEVQEVHIPGSYQVEIVDISAQLEQQRINEQSLKYLADTDWYCNRLVETQVAIPEEISTARAAARAAIVR